MKIGKYTITLKDKLTYGDFEKIQKSLENEKVSATNTEMTMGALLKMQQVALEVAVIEIVDDEGKEIAYSIDFLRGLDVEDGNDLLAEASSLLNNKKK